MSRLLPDSLLSQLSEFVADRFALDFPQQRWQDLERAVRGAYDEDPEEDGLEEFVRRLLISDRAQDELQFFIQHLTVGETYFFRERRGLEVVGERIVKELVQSPAAISQKIRIWSAGCASGEEAYSLAIMLSRVIPEVGQNVSIVATDLNASSLERARRGVYGDWSFRGAPEWLKPTYFKLTRPGRWSISSAIKEMVEFRYFNLMDVGYGSVLDATDGVDVILCRNVLMYCRSSAMESVIKGFHRSLRAGGWLIVGAAETSSALFHSFDRLVTNDVTIYRKRPVREHPAAHRNSGTSDRPGEMPVVQTSTLPAAGTPGQACKAAPVNLRIDKTRPGSASYEQAIDLYRRGLYESAEQMSIALRALNPVDTRILLLQARIYANLGRFQDALDCCHNALTEDKISAPAHYLRAAILEEQGLPTEAASALRKAIYADSQFVLGHFALGNLALKDRSLGDPCKHFENVLALLRPYRPGDIIPESDGLSVGELRKIALQNTHKCKQSAVVQRSPRQAHHDRAGKTHG